MKTVRIKKIGYEIRCLKMGGGLSVQKMETPPAKLGSTETLHVAYRCECGEEFVGDYVSHAFHAHDGAVAVIS